MKLLNNNAYKWLIPVLLFIIVVLLGLIFANNVGLIKGFNSSAQFKPMTEVTTPTPKPSLVATPSVNLSPTTTNYRSQPALQPSPDLVPRWKLMEWNDGTCKTAKPQDCQ